MSTKKSIARKLIFISVFTGTVIGEGISLLANPKTRTEIRNKIAGKIQDTERSIEDSLSLTLSRAIEVGTQLSVRVRKLLEGAGSIIRSVKKEINKCPPEEDGKVD
jgi:gas vesicle protein